MFVACATCRREQAIISILLERSTNACVTLPRGRGFAESDYTLPTGGARA